MISCYENQYTYSSFLPSDLLYYLYYLCYIIYICYIIFRFKHLQKFDNCIFQNHLAFVLHLDSFNACY